MSEFVATNAPDPPYRTLKGRFGAFHSIWVHLGSFRNCMKLVAKPAKLVQLIHKFVPRSHVGIFATNTPDPPHWTLNSCFHVSRCVSEHLAMFCYYTKLGAKRAELVQKFVVRSRFKIFRNERTRSIPLDPKLMFWCISYNFGALGTVWSTYETRCKTGRTGTKVRASKSRQNVSQPTHAIHPIGH